MMEYDGDIHTIAVYDREERDVDRIFGIPNILNSIGEVSDWLRKYTNMSRNQFVSSFREDITPSLGSVIQFPADTKFLVTTIDNGKVS